MCGICGFTGENDKHLLREMTQIIGHRGPDQQGFFLSEGINFGHRRLSIIDLSSAGKQPMTNDEGIITIAYNGEIYNYKELRHELEQQGYRFNSNTDTEVLIHGYAVWGPKILERLNGMFSFAIWDESKKRLFLARDRLGIKPLYYAIYNNELIFSSEMKSILLFPEFKRKLNLQSLSDYLSYRYVPEPQTILDGIYKLLPGHYLFFQKGNIQIIPYWQLKDKFKINYSQNGLKNKVRNLLSDSVNKRLMADVPLGVFLSGGLDSSSIVGLMKSQGVENIKTFSIGYAVKEKEDELNEAKYVANHFNTDHQELIVNENPLKILPTILWHMDEPIADPTSIPTYYLAQSASKKVKVVLSGEGADEVFGGYEQYKIMSLANKTLPLMPSFVKSKLIPYSYNNTPSVFKDYFFQYASSLGEEGRERFFSFIKDYKGNATDYEKIISIFTEKEKNKLNFNSSTYQPGLRFVEQNFKLDSNLFNKMTRFDLNMFLRHLLLKTDKMTMAHGLESRVPFLDHRVVSLGFSLPPSLKMNLLNEKYLLKKSMVNILPSRVIKRKKQRFFVPIDYWFETVLKEQSSNILLSNQTLSRGLFKGTEVENLLNKYKKSPLYYSRQLWSLLNFEIWARIYLDQEKIGLDQILSLKIIG